MNSMSSAQVKRGLTNPVRLDLAVRVAPCRRLVGVWPCDAVGVDPILADIRAGLGTVSYVGI